MVNAKAGIFVGIAIAVAVGIAFAASYSSVDTSGSEKLESVIDMTIDSSNPAISDDAIVDVENQNFDVNEDGKRHYTLVAKTEPVVSP
ncbi:hypothetical protein [Nitrosopumilus sp.]|uniref:hypothetical protein n=1 Tax=Nitrosopumilus sp. TaxID=2024843 RepID=UPI003D1119E4